MISLGDIYKHIRTKKKRRHKIMATNATENRTNNNAEALFLKISERFEKFPNLKYAATNARILGEPGEYSAADIQSCPDIEITMVEREEEPNNIVAWHEMGEKLDREIYYNKETNEVEDEDYEIIGMRMQPDKDHSDYWIKFN